jgi:hypothetical protein
MYHVMEAAGTSHANHTDYAQAQGQYQYGHQEKAKKPDPEANREQAAKMSKMSFTQKAGLAGAAITGGLFLIKSKILTFLSFLTAIPTAGLLYFGFFRGKKAKAEPVQEKTKEEKPPVSKENLELISKIQTIKESSDSSTVKSFSQQTMQAIAAADSTDPELIATLLKDHLHYEADKKALRSLKAAFHPDKHVKEDEAIQEANATLFKVVQEYENLQK